MQNKITQIRFPAFFCAHSLKQTLGLFHGNKRKKKVKLKKNNLPTTCNVHITRISQVWANTDMQKVFRINPVKYNTTQCREMRSGSALCYIWPSWRTIPPYLRFEFRRISYWDGVVGGGMQIDSNWGVDKNCAVCPKPFVVMCHTPARQTASWSGQQQTQLVEPRLRSLFLPSAL